MELNIFNSKATTGRRAQGMVLLPTVSARAPGLVVKLDPPIRGFFSRLKDFLIERPVKLPANAGHGALTGPTFESSFLDNLREWLRPIPPSARRVRSRMMVEWRPWYHVLWENLRDAIIPPKLPPLQVTSKPVKVREIWSKNELGRPTQLTSLLAHSLVLALLLLPILNEMAADPQAKTLKQEVTSIILSPYVAKLPPGGDKAGGGGGGGERLPTPASRGRAPKFSMAPQLTPPLVVPRNPNPKLAAEPTLIGPPEITIANPALSNYGDPLAKLLTDSSGPGSGSGIGSGSGGGIGSGTGGGLGPGEGGGVGGGVFQAGRNGVGVPECVYCPLPTFSPEAVKAKYQGPVTLRIIVLPDGRVTNATVIQGPGLGLDERALEAVRTWRFRPALGPNGKAVATWALVEVTFRLM